MRRMKVGGRHGGGGTSGAGAGAAGAVEDGKGRVGHFARIVLLALMVAVMAYWHPPISIGGEVAKPVAAATAVGATEAATAVPTTMTTLTIGRNNVIVKPVDCSTVPLDPNPILVTFNSTQFRPFSVSYSRWANGAKTQTHSDMGGSPVHHYLLTLPPDEMYIDVGGNIGQTSMSSLVAGRETYVFDPLEFDIQKLCEGRQANLDLGYVHENDASRFFIYRTLVGNEVKESFDISRPVDEFGRFEQASIFSNTVGVVRKPKLVTETVPMITLDALIPPDRPIGLVKIDVQGAELMVVQGMTQILSRTSGYPRTIFYEEQARVTQGAGVPLGAVQKLLEGYGYTCKLETASDIACHKERA